MAKILVIDDEPIPCRMLHHFLTGEGHEVRTALDADEAVQVAHDFRPDLLISDWLLKDKTGLDVALAVRDELPEARHLHDWAAGDRGGGESSLRQ